MRALPVQIKLLAVLWMLISLLLSACGVFEVGIERTATPDAGAETTPLSFSTPTPTPYMDVWDTFTSPVFGISLEYPADWQPVYGYGAPETGETRFAGITGFFHINAMGGTAIDHVTKAEAEHRLLPYGSQPTVENLQVQGQEARLILPSADQPAGMDYQAALIVRYPQPMNITGSTYQYFVLWADKSHIRTFAQTLRFSADSVPSATSGAVGSAGYATPTTADADLATRVAASETDLGTRTALRPTPTSVLDGGYLSYHDPVLGLSLDIPMWWDIQAAPGAVTRFYQQDHTGALLNVLTISALSPESDTLELALEEVSQGAWGPYIRAEKMIRLGGFDAMRLELSSGPGRPPVAWLVVAPSGRAVGIMAEGDPAWIERVIDVVLDTLRPIDSAALVATPVPEGLPTAVPVFTPLPAGSATDLMEPLLIDGEKGWIFASAQVDGQPKTVKLATQDGRLLGVFDAVGKLALDRRGNRLFVDQGEAGLAILDAETGALRATVALPEADPANANPQVDPTTGLIYAFRGKTIYVIDPATLTLEQALTLEIPATVCDDPGEDAPIARSFYDLVNNKLYLAFSTRVCTPWVQHTVVAYDAATLAELGRYETEANYHAVPYLDSLYGTMALPIGRNVSWAWNGRETWFEEGDDGGGRLQGIVADWGRQLIYEALGGEVRVLQAYPPELLGQTVMAPLEGDGRLAGHDPISDQLYFLVNGHLEVRPTSDILATPTEQTGDSMPYCRPSEAAVSLSASATTLQVGQTVTVTVTLVNGDTSGVRLGLIQYILRMGPLDLFGSENPEPVVNRVSLEPGASDEAQFVLRAETPGIGTLTASTSFEIHAMDYSWGSWSGCDSWPLEIVVTP